MSRVDIPAEHYPLHHRCTKRHWLLVLRCIPLQPKESPACAFLLHMLCEVLHTIHQLHGTGTIPLRVQTTPWSTTPLPLSINNLQLHGSQYYFDTPWPWAPRVLIRFPMDHCHTGSSAGSGVTVYDQVMPYAYMYVPQTFDLELVKLKRKFGRSLMEFAMPPSSITQIFIKPFHSPVVDSDFALSQPSTSAFTSRFHLRYHASPFSSVPDLTRNPLINISHPLSYIISTRRVYMVVYAPVQHNRCHFKTLASDLS